jgi:hypothetical protein
MIPFLFMLGLCALPHSAGAHPVQMDEAIPGDSAVHVLHLSNGIQTYMQENTLSPEHGSFRIVLKRAPGEIIQYAFDGKLDEVEEFFFHCAEKLSSERTAEGQPFGKGRTSFSDLPSVSKGCPWEMAVIAVGDFSSDPMQQLVQKHFGDLVLVREREELPNSCGNIQVGRGEEISKVALLISYPYAGRPITTYRDLVGVWKNIFLQELFQQRMERSARGLDEAWVHPHPRFFYPVNGYAFASAEHAENILSFLIWQVEAIRSEGFYEDEFHSAKQKMLSRLQFLASRSAEPDTAFLASYYADQFLLGGSCLDYQSFLGASESLVQGIAPADLVPHLEDFFLEGKRQIQVVYPKSTRSQLLTRAEIEDLIERVASLASFYRDGELADEETWNLETRDAPASFLPSVMVSNKQEEGFQIAESALSPFTFVNAGPTESFYALLTDREKRFIKAIVSTMAEKNIFQLALERRTLEKKGDKVHHVHPMRFLGFILADPDLKDGLKSIKKSSFKWDAFVSGFGKRMKEEYGNGNLYQHVPGFAQQVGASPENIYPFLDKKDWDGLVKSLL